MSPPQRKKILVLWWSQSGQVRRVADAFTAPLAAAGHDVVFVETPPEVAYPFPWKTTQFFGRFPETVLERPIALAPIAIPDEDWDLVIVATQIWFLSPSQPFTAFLQSPHASVLRGRRVITLIGCRNMWINGWRRMVRRIQALGGDVQDRVVAVHSGNVSAGYFTTLFWMLTGRRDAIKVLPKAEIHEATYTWLGTLGQVAADRIVDTPAGTPLLADQRTETISHAHAMGEQLMGRIFPILAHIGVLTRPDTNLRGVFAVFMLSVILSAVLTLLIPCLVIRTILRRWVDPWLDRLGSLPVEQ